METMAYCPSPSLFPTFAPEVSHTAHAWMLKGDMLRSNPSIPHNSAPHVDAARQSLRSKTAVLLDHGPTYLSALPARLPYSEPRSSPERSRARGTWHLRILCNQVIERDAVWAAGGLSCTTTAERSALSSELEALRSRLGTYPQAVPSILF